MKPDNGLALSNILHALKDPCFRCST